MEAMQYVAQQPMGNWINQEEIKIIPGNKWKWRHNDSKHVRWSISKAVLRGKFIAIQASGNKKNPK